MPVGAADLYQRIPDMRITDILLEVDDATKFIEAFTHLRTGSPCRDRMGLLNVLLAEGINLGLRKKAIYGPGTDLADRWARDRRAELEAGRLCAVVAALRIHVETTPEARKCIHYVFRNRHRMRYPQFCAKGLCVSTDVVKAGCKQIGDRLKRAGMRRTVAGANAIIALCCCILSGRFEDFWERRAASAA